MDLESNQNESDRPTKYLYHDCQSINRSINMDIRIKMSDIINISIAVYR